MLLLQRGAQARGGLDARSGLQHGGPEHGDAQHGHTKVSFPSGWAIATLTWTATPTLVPTSTPTPAPTCMLARLSIMHALSCWHTVGAQAGMLGSALSPICASTRRTLRWSLRTSLDSVHRETRGWRGKGACSVEQSVWRVQHCGAEHGADASAANVGTDIRADASAANVGTDTRAD